MTDNCFICGVWAPDGYWDQIHALYLYPSCAARERNNARLMNMQKTKGTLL